MEEELDGLYDAILDALPSCVVADNQRRGRVELVGYEKSWLFAAVSTSILNSLSQSMHPMR